MEDKKLFTLGIEEEFQIVDLRAVNYALTFSKYWRMGS